MNSEEEAALRTLASGSSYGDKYRRRGENNHRDLPNPDLGADVSEPWMTRSTFVRQLIKGGLKESRSLLSRSICDVEEFVQGTSFESVITMREWAISHN